MDRRDRHQFVQQYVERQKPYLPTYTTEHLNERHGTPSKPLRSDEFGFDTPVLRPRVLKKAAQSQLMPPTGASESRTEPKQAAAPSEAALGKKDKPRSKRKKASTPTDTDNEHAARLADRRERKRKKRAIVNPPQNDTAPKKGRANGQNAKKPTALALLYGFSATNVTKGRLTLQPAPSLGVFNKGKASAKKKVAITGKSSSRKEFFSESAFLNTPSERVADHSRIDDDPDDSSVSSISNHPMPRAIRTAKKDRRKCTEAPAVETRKASTHTAAESEVWDIEVQSKLPSSARDVSSDPEDSAPVVRGAEWRAMTEERRTKAGTPVTRGRSRGRSVVCGSPPAPSDELRLSHAADAPSIHPSHSASQIGRRDAQPSDLRLVTSKYFTEPEPATVQRAPQTSRSNDINDVPDSQIPGQDATLDVQTIQRADPSTNSLSSVAQPVVEFQTRYDMAPLEFPSDGDDWYTRPDVPWEPLGRPDRGYFESSVVEIPGDRSISAVEYHHHHHPHQGTAWDCHLADLTTDDVEDVPVEAFQGPCDPFAREYEDDLGEQESAVEPCFFDTHAEYDVSGQWFCMAETGQDFAAYEEMSVDGSMCGSEESLHYDEPRFLEGRALLQDHWERPWGARLSGLVQAEMDVASQLRDHWRPLRL